MTKRAVGIVSGLSAVILSGCVLGFHPSRLLYVRSRSIEIVSADGTILSGTLSLPRYVIISGPEVSTGLEEFYSRLTGDGHRTPQVTDAAEIRARVAAFPGPAGYEPADRLLTSRVPTLWLLGERDESVPTFATVRVLDSIRAAGTLYHTVIVYADSDHSLRNVTTGEPAPMWVDAFSWLQNIGVMHPATQ